MNYLNPKGMSALERFHLILKESGIENYDLIEDEGIKTIIVKYQRGGEVSGALYFNLRWQMKPGWTLKMERS